MSNLLSCVFCGGPIGDVEKCATMPPAEFPFPDEGPRMVCERETVQLLTHLGNNAGYREPAPLTYETVESQRKLAAEMAEVRLQAEARQSEDRQRRIAAAKEEKLKLERQKVEQAERAKAAAEAAAESEKAERIRLQRMNGRA